MRFYAPWQTLVAALFLYALIYVLLTVFAVVCIWLSWSYISATLLFGAFAVLAFLGPLSLSWTRNSYRVLIPMHLLHQAATVLVYAAHYMRAGLSSSDGSLAQSYADAIYFSLTMWTTLGTNDFFVPKALRLLTALEALTAVLFLPVFAAVFWEMLQEMTPPPEEAFLDRSRGQVTSQVNASK